LSIRSKKAKKRIIHRFFVKYFCFFHTFIRKKM